MARPLASGACYKITKYLVFAFNILFWILGLVILGIGIAVRVDSHFGKVLADNIPYMYTGAYLLIFVGLIILIIGFLGCCGAIQESQCMLFLYFLSLFLVFILLMSAGLWAYASKTKMQQNIRTMFKKAMAKYVTNGNNDETVFMDYVQNALKCCGVDGATDYSTAQIVVPKSCGEHITTQISRKGCSENTIIMAQANMSKITGVGIGIGIIMMFGMVLSMMLCCALKEING